MTISNFDAIVIQFKLCTNCVRFNKKYEYELSRFCSKNICNVIGGASKLWKYFIKTYNPLSVISYSNIAISNPDYIWLKNNKHIKS